MAKWYEKIARGAGNLWEDVTGGTQAKASIKAAGIGAEQQQKALEEQRRQFDITQQNAAPWMQAGQRALGSLESGLASGQFSMPDFNFTEQQYQASPAFRFQLEQGTRAADAGASARGGALGGNQARALTSFGQGLAAQDYGNAFNRAYNQYGANMTNRQNQFGRYSQLAGLGQQTGAQLSQMGQNFANSVGNIYGNMGDYQAGGILGAANARAQGTSNLLNLGARGLGAYFGAA